MDDKQVIRQAWSRLPAELRARAKYDGVVVRAPEPMGSASFRADCAEIAPTKEKSDFIEFAGGPFGAVLGKWRGTVTLV